MLNHRFQQNHGSIKIVVIIFQRIDHTFSNKRACSKVNNRVNFLFFEQSIQKFFIPDITLVKSCFLMNGFLMTCHQIINNNDILSRVNKLINSVGTYISCTAQNKYGHSYLFLLSYSDIYFILFSQSCP